MEGEIKQVKQKQQVFDILNESLSIYVNNINFIIFTLLASLPFMIVMVYFEPLLQETLAETPKIVNDLLVPFYNDMFHDFPLWNHGGYALFLYDPEYEVPRFSKDYLPVMIQLGFLYFVPLHVVQICSAVVTIYSASELRSQDNKISLKHMFQNSTGVSIMKGAFITSLYMLSLSTGFLFAIVWTVSNCYILYMMLGCYYFFAAVCCVCTVKLLMIYLEWSGIWNMSIVVSVLDGIYGTGALRVSCFFSSGNQKKGLLLMLVFFVLELCLRLPCVYLGYYEGGYGIFVQIGLISVVNTLKWVSCMVYFCDCKERRLVKKVDVELGKGLQKSDPRKTFSVQEGLTVSLL